MTAPSETCNFCRGIGLAGYSSPGGPIPCPTCHGSGRVPVPLVDCTKDDRDLEADALREKLGIAREALEALRDRGIHADTNPSNAHIWNAIQFYNYLADADRLVRSIARDALEKLK